MKFEQKSLQKVILTLFLIFFGSQAVQAEKILCISETTETKQSYYYNGKGFYLYLLEKYLSPEKILHDDFTVTQVGWSEAKEYLDRCSSYDAVIFWETPCYIRDQRNNDPYHQDIDVVPESTAHILTKYVQDGGALIIAGGVTNYGNGHPELGFPPSQTGKRDYIGYTNSPIAEILPVAIKPEVTIQSLNRMDIEIAGDVALLKGIPLNEWPINAYHNTVAKPGTETIAEFNHAPLICRWQQGKGKVIAVTAAPRANTLVKSEKEALNPIWPQEAILWDRVIRWALDKPFLSKELETSLANKYRQIVSCPQPLPQGFRLEEYPYAAHILDDVIPDNMQFLPYKYFSDLKFNHIILQSIRSEGEVTTPAGQASLNQWCQYNHEALEKNNLYMILHPGIAETIMHYYPDPERWAQKVLPSGKNAMHYANPNPCPYSTLVQTFVKEQMEPFMSVVSPYKRMRGIFPEDEWSWVLGYRNPYQGDQGIGCYSPWVNERFKKITGQQAPEPVYHEKGYVAPEDDLWLKWCQEIRQDAFNEYNQIITDIARKNRKDYLVSGYPGGFEGNTGLMVEEVYLDCWRQSPLLTVERMDVRSNFRMDTLRNKYPVWALIGIFRMPEDKSMYPETMRLTTGLCLGTGAKGIILWNSINLWGQYFQHPNREWLETEAERFGRYLHKFGPMFLELEKEPADMWILSGWFWVNSFDNYLHIPPQDTSDYNTETPWWNIQISDIVCPATMRAGIYPEFVTEKQLLSDELFKQKAVMLPGAVYSRQGVVDNLEKYIKKGGKVYMDQSAEIKIEGAEILPVDFAAWHRDIGAGKRPTVTPTEANYRKQRKMSEAYIKDAINVMKEKVLPAACPKIAINSTLGAWTMMVNGDTKYLFVYNCDEDNPNQFTVTCRDVPDVVYDIEKGKCISQGNKSIKIDVSLPAGGWKVYALSPQKVHSIKIDKANAKNEKLIASATIQTRKGDIFRAAVPVKILLQKDGEKSVELYRSTSEGKLECEIPLGRSAFTPEKITVTELFTGKQASIAVK